MTRSVFGRCRGKHHLFSLAVGLACAAACGTENPTDGTGGAPSEPTIAGASGAAVTATGGSGGAGVSGSGAIAGASGSGAAAGAAASGGTAGASPESGAAGVAMTGGAGSSGMGGGGTAGTGGAAAGTSGEAGFSGMAGSSASAGESGTGAGGTPAGGSGAGGMGGMGGASGNAGSGGSAGVGGAADVMFTPNVRLNDDNGRGRQAEVALATGPNGLAIAGWMDERSERVCAFSVSTDAGETWSENYSIALTTGSFVGDPAVAIDGGGTLYAVCMEYGLEQIRMMTSSDDGVTWSENRAIQSAPDKPWAGGGIAEGEVFVSWLGQNAGIKRSLDGGVTWEPTQPLGNIIHGTDIVTSTTGLVHVPYNLDSNRNQLRYLRSTDGGESWEDFRDLLPDMGSFCFNCTPRQHPIVGAAADPTGEIVAITWSSQMPGGQSQEDVWLLYSSDGGDTWTDPIRVNDNDTTSRQFQPWVAVDAHGRVHVAWTDLRDDGLNKTYYARSADPTQGFEPNIEVTDERGTASVDFLGDYKGIAISGPDVLVVWQDTRRDSGDIYFSRAPGAAGP